MREEKDKAHVQPGLLELCFVLLSEDQLSEDPVSINVRVSILSADQALFCSHTYFSLNIE